VQLRELFLRHVGQTSPAPLAFSVDHAEGVWLHGPNGERTLDLIAGIAVSSLGHGHPAVIEAVRHQAGRYLHTMVYGELVQAPQVRFAERVAGLLPDPLDSVFFVNSGSEAVEGALKLAKRITGRTELVGFRNAYHGSTHGALSVGGTEAWKQAFRPLLPDVRSLEFGSNEDLAQLSERTAAVLVEPVQGEAGVRIPPTGWLQALSDRCRALGILLIFDESQTGCGRTGKMFALEHSGVVPDILVLAKAFGGGMPLGAFIASREHMQALTADPVLGHICTFGGHPVSCAAGLAAMEALTAESLLDRVPILERLFREGLEGQAGVREVRSCGLMMAVQLDDFSHNKAVIDEALRLGVMTDWFLYCDDALRIAPPLIISDTEAEWAINVLQESLHAVYGAS
jgi:acetylornithine/succinyldiaminopimelate/putrescine aminotransferase